MCEQWASSIHPQRSSWPDSCPCLQAPEFRMNWWERCLAYEFGIYYLDQQRSFYCVVSLPHPVASLLLCGEPSSMNGLIFALVSQLYGSLSVCCALAKELVLRAIQEMAEQSKLF